MAAGDNDKGASGNDERSFLKTPTGVGAIAALVTAIVGLLTFFANLFGGNAGVVATPVQTVTVSTTPSATPRPTPLDELLAHIPPAYAPYCAELETLTGGAVAGLSCHLPVFPGVGGVNYYLFASRAELYAFFQPRLEQRVTPAGNVCGEDQFGESTYSASGVDQVGWLLCYEQEDRNYLEWTRDSYLIYAWIESTASSKKVFDVWRSAGPVNLDSASPSVSPG